MLFSSCIAALALLFCTASTSSIEEAQAIELREAPCTLVPTENYAKLVWSKYPSSSPPRWWHHRRHPHHEYHTEPGNPTRPNSTNSTVQSTTTTTAGPSTTTTTASPSATNAIGQGDDVGLFDVGHERQWAAIITIGGQEVMLDIDTGSYDTWVAQQGFKCVVYNDVPLPEAACRMGPLYNGSFTEGEIPNESFHIRYADGKRYNGIFGYTDVAIGNITVEHQQVALVSNGSSWTNVTSGILGLGYGYNGTTSAFAGNNFTLDNSAAPVGTAPGKPVIHLPIVETMITQGLNPPLFTLALERSSDPNDTAPGGYMAFGGLPPVSGTIGSFVDTPIIKNSSIQQYNIVPDGYVFQDKKNSSTMTTVTNTAKALVDSGATALYLPIAVFYDYIATFDPAMLISNGGGTYYYPCNATAPYLGITIAGETFEIDSADIVRQAMPLYGNATGANLCPILVYGNERDVYGNARAIFGDVFLKNVVAVFDVGADAMRFAKHTY